MSTTTGALDALAAIAGVLGLAIGSFLNVVVYRVPRGKSLVHPGSSCPSCGAPVRWFDNVPVVSWIVLRGRCRSCHRPISLRYPLVELATGGLFAALVLAFAH
jgi:leader peptidase (prepilin peptidase) / N-methyltransferase